MPAERPFRRRERWPRGAGSAECGGRGRWCGDGEDRATGLGALPDPASSLLSVSKRCPGSRASRKLDGAPRLGFPEGDGRTGGRVGEGGARWQLSPPETKGAWGDARGRGQPGISGNGWLTSPLPPGGEHP